MANVAGTRDRLAAETLLGEARANFGAPPSALELARWLAARTSPERRRLALELDELRRRASGRLRDAEQLLLTAKGLEQASSSIVAQWRARTLDGRAPRALALVDLTAGLGLDAAALAAMRPVVAQDLDPTTAALCAINLERTAPGRALAICADARRPAARAPLVAVDPDRRPLGRRERDPARWSPTWAECAAALSGAEGGVAKLPPASDPLALAEALPGALPIRWSFVGRGRELVELTLWTGCLAQTEDEVEAVALGPEGEVAQRLAGPRGAQVPALDPEQAAQVTWIVEPHPAVLRSGLVALLAPALGAAPLGPGLGFLGPLDPSQPAPQPRPLWRVERVRDSAPADPKRVRRMLAEHQIGPVRVHARGHPDSPDQLERRFRGKGTRPGRLLLARLERGHRAYLVDGGELDPN